MSDLELLELCVKAPDGIRLSQSMGSLLHGVIMERLDPCYAAFLHEQGLRPYSQAIYFDPVRKNWFWRLGALDKTAKQNILAMVYDLRSSIYLTHSQLELELVDRQYISDLSRDALMEKHFSEKHEFRRVKFEFLTPASFKKEEQYMIFPQPQQLIGSLLSKWNAYAGRYALEGKNIVENLAEEVFVADYNLHMQRFYLEGTCVPAFKGRYVLGLKGNKMANKIIGLLGDYAEFCGVGIKTALGMGAVRCELE